MLKNLKNTLKTHGNARW